LLFCFEGDILLRGFLRRLEIPRLLDNTIELQSNADGLAVAVTLELFEIALVLVRLDHLANVIVNANGGIM
jgi:hypothetical protein